MKNIFTEIKDSIYNPNFYQTLPAGRSLGSSVKYLAKLCLLLALVGVIIFSFQIPSFYKMTRDGIKSSVANYPDDLVLSVKDGVASSKRVEPYIFPVDKFFEDNPGDMGTHPENILVIDTTKSFSTEDFNKYSTYVMVSKTEIAALKNTNSEQIQLLPFSKLGKFEITKPWVMDKEVKVLKVLPWIVPALIVLVFFAIFSVNFIGSLVMLFLYGFVIWLISKIKKVELSYKNSYKLGIHALTIILIIEFLSSALRVPVNFFIKLVVFIVFIYVVFFRNYTNPTIEEKL